MTVIILMSQQKCPMEIHVLSLYVIKKYKWVKTRFFVQFFKSLCKNKPLPIRFRYFPPQVRGRIYAGLVPWPRSVLAIGRHEVRGWVPGRSNLGSWFDYVQWSEPRIPAKRRILPGLPAGAKEAMPRGDPARPKSGPHGPGAVRPRKLNHAIESHHGRSRMSWCFNYFKTILLCFCFTM